LCEIEKNAPLPKEEKRAADSILQKSYYNPSGDQGHAIQKLMVISQMATRRSHLSVQPNSYK